MSRVIRTLIFFDSDPGDEAQVHEVCAKLEAKRIHARAVSLADLKRAGFKDEKTDPFSLDLRFLGIDVKLVQVFCLKANRYGHSDGFTAFYKSVHERCRYGSAKKRGYGDLYINHTQNAAEAVSSIEKYLARIDANLDEALTDFEQGKMVSLNEQERSRISYRYDLYSSYLCRTIKPESKKDEVIACLKKLRKRLENRLELLIPPYSSPKFATFGLEDIEELLLRFETYGKEFDDPLIHALRVHIVRGAARTLVRKLAAEKYLLGNEPSGDEKYRSALADWDDSFSHPGKKAASDSVLYELMSEEDAEYRDLLMCETAYRAALEVSMMTSCPGLDQSEPYGYSLGDIENLFKTVDSFAIPRLKDEAESSAAEAESESGAMGLKAAGSMLDSVADLYRIADSFNRRELNCFMMYAARSAAFSQQLGFDGIKQKICSIAAKAREYYKKSSASAEGPEGGFENALRAALGLKLIGQKDGTYDIFISYKRHDKDEDKALRDHDNHQMRTLYNELVNSGLNPFLDVIELPNRGDFNWVASLEAAVDRSENFLLMLRSDGDLASENVRRELIRYLVKYSPNKKVNSPMILSPRPDIYLPDFLKGFEIIEYDAAHPGKAAEKIVKYIFAQNRNAEPEDGEDA